MTEHQSYRKMMIIIKNTVILHYTRKIILNHDFFDKNISITIVTSKETKISYKHGIFIKNFLYEF